ncbi:MAG TPA: hypothetical protein PK156_45510 [Polyangium sp.]|nr:hypothetical protein [Polyangium sp.]
MTRNDVMVLGNATFHLTVEKWVADKQPVKQISRKALSESRTLDEILGAFLRRVELERRWIDYAGGW